MGAVYSFLVPLYNEEETLGELYRRVCGVMDTLDGESELILIDDGSTDRSLQMIRSLERQDARVRYVSFARNFGHQVALTAGMSAAQGACVIILDADLQDPPEVVPQMVELWRQGNHIVYARRNRRERESALKRLFAYGYYRVLRTLADIEIPADAGDFCLLDRCVVDVLNGMPERHRYLRGLRSWTGFRHGVVSFDRAPRFAGAVKYSFQKSLKLAISGLVAFSAGPLRFSTYIGLFSAGIAATMSLLVVYWRVATPNSPVVGFAWIATVMFFLAGVQLVCIGILGEYVARIHDEVKARPLFVVKETSKPIPPRAGVGVTPMTAHRTDAASEHDSPADELSTVFSPVAGRQATTAIPESVGS